MLFLGKSNPEFSNQTLEEGKATGLLSLFLLATWKKTIHFVSVVQLGLTAAHTASTAFVGVKQIIFRSCVFYF